jgi:hypothetical protein
LPSILPCDGFSKIRQRKSTTLYKIKKPSLLPRSTFHFQTVFKKAIATFFLPTEFGLFTNDAASIINGREETPQQSKGFKRRSPKQHKEKPMKNRIVALAGLILVGCATSATTLNKVSVGMTKAQVVKALGQPQSTRAKEGIEYLHYKFSEAGDWVLWPLIQHDYFVRLTNGVVDAYGKAGDFNSNRPAE